MFEKYLIVKESNIISGQDAKTKQWYCKELPAKTVKETNTLIDELNKIYNQYNKDVTKENTKKDKAPPIKGLK